MAQPTPSVLPALLKSNAPALIRDWAAARRTASASLSGSEVDQQSKDFLNNFQSALQSGSLEDITSDAWETTRSILADISGAHSRQGTSATDIAIFVLSMKEPLFALLQKEYAKEPETIAREIWNSSRLIDKLALFTTDLALKNREEQIQRQQAEMLELSTPVVKLWDGVLALPLIGTLDSERTQVVMETLLQEIVRTEAGIAIIDITGVPTVDTLVAQHLLKTVAAARLMGAECIISGIRPQIASTIVHLGVDLGDVATKASLADAFKLALTRNGLHVTASRTLRTEVAG